MGYSECGIKSSAAEKAGHDAEVPKRGAWVTVRRGENVCSVCGGYPKRNNDGSPAYTPYCPHCGAKLA